MTIDLFDIFYILIMELIDFAIIYGIFYLIVRRLARKTSIYITAAIFSAYVIFSSYSTAVLTGQIGFYDITSPIVFIVASILTCKKAVAKINKKHEDTIALTEEMNLQSNETGNENKEKTNGAKKLTVGIDVFSGKHIIVPTDSNDGIIHVFKNDEIIDRKLINKEKVVNFKQGTKVAMYNCEIKQ